jgi:deoxyribonuclease V
VNDLDRLSIAEARALQQRMRALVSDVDGIDTLQRIAGADVSYDRGSSLMCAAIVVEDATTGETLEIATAARHVRFPYVPGLLSFRELPPLAVAFAALTRMPDVILCDGHGRAHPRRFGLACHLGVALDRPSIGCAKSLLVGTHREPGPLCGAHARIVDAGETIGSVLRTRDGVRPMFVSVGHRVSLATARAIVLAQCRGQRIPHPLRAAHDAANALRRARRGQPRDSGDG